MQPAKTTAIALYTLIISTALAMTGCEQNSPQAQVNTTTSKPGTNTSHNTSDGKASATDQLQESHQSPTVTEQGRTDDADNQMPPALQQPNESHPKAAEHPISVNDFILDKNNYDHMASDRTAYSGGLLISIYGQPFCDNGDDCKISQQNGSNSISFTYHLPRIERKKLLTCDIALNVCHAMISGYVDHNETGEISVDANLILWLDPAQDTQTLSPLSSQNNDTQQSKKPIILKIDQSGTFYWNDTQADESDLKAMFAVMAQQSNPPEIQIKVANDGVSCQYVAAVLADAWNYNVQPHVVSGQCQ